MRIPFSTLVLIGFASLASLAQSPATDPKQEALSLQPGAYYWTVMLGNR